MWFTRQETALNLEHLSARMLQTGDWTAEHPLSHQAWKDRLHQAINELDIEAAKRDVLPFVRDASQLELWSADFFHALEDMIRVSVNR